VRSWYRWAGNIYCYDGAQNDAHFAIVLARLIYNLRLKYLPSEYHSLLRRYYEYVYLGFISVDGFLFRFPGNLSGQFNTMIDNSLLTLAICMLHAIRANIAYESFLEDYHFFILGDDLLILDSTELYAPFSLEKTYRSLGMYLESPKAISYTYDEITFMGVHTSMYQGKPFYHYDEVKLLDSYNYHKDIRDWDKILSKCVAINMLLFSSRLFPSLRQHTLSMLFDHGSDLMKRTVPQLLDETYLLNLYTSFESLNAHGSFLSCVWSKVQGLLKKAGTV